METEQLSRELYQQMQHNDDKVICLKTIDYHVTIIGYWVVDKHTRGGENVIFSATCEAKKVFGVIDIALYQIMALRSFPLK